MRAQILTVLGITLLEVVCAAPTQRPGTNTSNLFATSTAKAHPGHSSKDALDDEEGYASCGFPNKAGGPDEELNVEENDRTVKAAVLEQEKSSEKKKRSTRDVERDDARDAVSDCDMPVCHKLQVMETREKSVKHPSRNLTSHEIEADKKRRLYLISLATS